MQFEREVLSKIEIAMEDSHVTKSKTTQSTSAAAGSNPLLAIPFATWMRAIGSAATWNSRCQQDLMRLGDEYRQFLSGRLNRNFDLVRQVASAKSIEQVGTAYAAFLQQAAQDYAQQSWRIGTFAGEQMCKTMVDLAPRAEELRPVAPWAVAA